MPEPPPLVDQGGWLDAVPAGTRRRHPWRSVLAAGAVLLVAVAAYVGADAYVVGRVPRGVTVDGVDLGGLTPEAAALRLREQLLPQLELPLRTTVGPRTYRVAPAQAGLGVDVQATVAAAAAVGAGRHPVIRFVFGGADLRPVVVVDPSRLRATLDALARQVAAQPRDGSVRFSAATGALVVQPAVLGAGLDVPAAGEALRAAWAAGDDAVVLPVRRTEPRVGPADIARAVQGFARPAASGPVRVVGRRTALLPSAAVLRATTMRPDGTGALHPVIGAVALRRAVGPAVAALTVPPRDATVAIIGGQPVVQPARAGMAVSFSALARMLPAALVAQGVQRQLPMPAVIWRPSLTTAGAAALRVERVLATATVPSLAGPGARAPALSELAARIDGVLLRPGAELDLGRVAGVAPGQPVGAALGRLVRALGPAFTAAGLRPVPATGLPPGARFANRTHFGVLVSAVLSRSGSAAVVTVRLWGPGPK